jgi:hypothetical protein
MIFPQGGGHISKTLYVLLVYFFITVHDKSDRRTIEIILSDLCSSGLLYYEYRALVPRGGGANK